MSNVLLVDDNELVRVLTKQWLERHGHVVVAIGTVDDAIAYLKQEAMGAVPTIDLLILDLELGNGHREKFSGLEVLAHVPHRMKRAIISGYMPDEVATPLPLISMYLSKPMTDEQKTRLLVLANVAGRRERES